MVALWTNNDDDVVVHGLVVGLRVVAMMAEKAGAQAANVEDIRSYYVAVLEGVKKSYM